MCLLNHYKKANYSLTILNNRLRFTYKQGYYFNKIYRLYNVPLTLSIYVTQSTKVEVSHVQNVNDLCIVPMILQLTGTQVQALLASISRFGSGEKIFNDLTFSNPGV